MNLPRLIKTSHPAKPLLSEKEMKRWSLMMFLITGIILILIPMTLIFNLLEKVGNI